MTKKVVLYARVSTDRQTAKNQLIELRGVAQRNGWEVIHEYVDRAVSGSKSSRPQLDAMMKALVRKEFDVVMAWSVDRLGRSMRHLLALLDDMHSKGVDLYLHQQGIDTTTPSGKALFQMCGVFAEFERSMIVERVKSGLERAKAQGKVLGRPKITAAKERSILAARRKGLGIIKTAKKCGVGVSAVQRVVAENGV